MDTGQHGPHLGHDPWCWILLLWPFAEEKCALHDMDELDLYRRRVFPGPSCSPLSPKSTHRFLSSVVFLGIFSHLQRQRQQIYR